MQTGPEVVEQAVRVLNTINTISSEIEFKLSFHDIGGAAIDKSGENLPDTTLKACKEADGILLGRYNLSITCHIRNISYPRRCRWT